MKQFTISILIIFLGIIVCGCNSTDNHNFATIEPGIYVQKAQRTMVGKEQFSASPIGNYFQRRFQFFKKDSLHINVKSDIPDENGVSRATYMVSGQELTIKTKNSTTTVYDSRSVITFDPIEIVGDSFTKKFPDGSEQFVFKGPGLLLHSRHPDRDDIDQDGDTTEIVDKTLFLKFSVFYD